ncbi:hypothetical protein ACFLYB_04850, partial [Chloroflexota bacterium]
TGDVTESYSITVGGIDPRWCTLSAQSISLPPSDKLELILTVKPPLISSGEAEKYTAVLKVTSKRDSSITATLPVEMRVGSLLEFDLRLDPQKQKGKKGSFTVIITNKGDKAATYDLEGKDSYNACLYEFSQKSINLQPGESGRVSLSVIPKERPFRGSVKTYEFKVSVAPRGGLPYQSRRVTGELTYKPVLRTIPAFILIMTVIIAASLGVSLYPMDGNKAESSPPDYFTLTINMYGNGTPSGYGIYELGTIVSISVNPAPLWKFAEWTGDIDTIADRLSDNTSIVMDQDYTIMANLIKTRDIILNEISNVVFYPQSPITIDYGNWATVVFDFTTDVNLIIDVSDYDEPIWRDVYAEVRPFSNGSPSPGYYVHDYNLLRYSQQVESEFTIDSQLDRVVVDQIRIRIQPADKSRVLNEIIIPVEFIFQ